MTQIINPFFFVADKTFDSINIYNSLSERKKKKGRERELVNFNKRFIRVYFNQFKKFF